MTRNRRLTIRDDNFIEMDQFYNSRVTSEITQASKDHPRCLKKNSALMIFCAILVMFWMAFIFLAYIVFHPEDFVSLKPLKTDQYPAPSPPLPVGQDPSLFRFEKNVQCKCEHYEYLTDFRSDEVFPNIWILLVFCIIGILISTSALHGILTNSPYFLDPWAFFLFVYGLHKLFIAAILFVVKCPGGFLLKNIILADPSVILVGFLNLKIPIRLILLILAVPTFCILMCLTRFRNYMVKKNMKKKMETQSV